jgi:hypothetical protein
MHASPLAGEADSLDAMCWVRYQGHEPDALDRHGERDKAMVRMLAVAIVVLPLLVGGGVPSAEANRPAIEDCPFEFDPSLVVGQFLGWLRIEVGQTLDHTRTWSDPDGDPARAKLLDGPDGMRLYSRSKLNSYTLLWTPKQPQVVAAVVRVTDEPHTGEPLHSTGTILIQVVPAARRAAPGACGGRPQ